MPQALCFQSVKFDVIERNQLPWVRGYQIGTALGYGENADISVRKLYTRHSDEFTPAMTAVVTLPTEGGPQETRIFSLRGCHLLAMFSRTPVAKSFRRWVLDVIEQYGDQVPVSDPTSLPEASITITPSTTASRKPLEKLVKVWARQGGLIHAQCWTMLNAAFNLQSITELPEEWVPDAIAWVQAKIDGQMKALPPAAPLPSSPEELVERFERISNKFIMATYDIRNELTVSLMGTYNPQTRMREYSPLESALNYGVGGMVTALGQNIEALRYTFRVVAENAKR